MKLRTLFLLSQLFIPMLSVAQYKPVESASTLTFNIRNLGFNVAGSFKGFDGLINFDPRNLAASNFDVTITSATVNTDNNLRDSHVRDEFFEVKTYPKIRLASTKLGGKDGNYVFTGLLTIKSTTKPISFPFTATEANDSYLFKGGFKIKRKDFGVGGTSTVSDELEVILNVTAKK
ncbi:YceI family protein [Mucilaginibacter sp. dw_454]|uniref:YceI family protein n=1 Tax=Mucilaginibacter sp. dw_454 TaxID=2720079 RepID=UPI001BD581F9|nr:YceI family protein [Mucilaginibacter sp. dw_454]